MNQFGFVMDIWGGGIHYVVVIGLFQSDYSALRSSNAFLNWINVLI